MSELWFDVETTGLSKDKHAIVEIACIPVIDGVEHDPFHSYMRPFEGAMIDKKALEVNKLDATTIFTYPKWEKVLDDLIEFLKSKEAMFHCAGHNVKFDRDFLYAMFCRAGKHTDFMNLFRPTTVDTFKKAQERKKYIRSKKLTLGVLCKYFDIPLENAHCALDDIKSTIILNDHLDAIQAPYQVKQELQESELTYQQKRDKYMGSKYIMQNPNGDIYIQAAASHNKDIMRFILNELMEVYCTT